MWFKFNAVKKVLLVEDDQSLGFVIRDSLSMKGYDVTWCRNGDEAQTTFFSDQFNICVLDIMLPRKDGITLARNIREHNKHIPILFLTAKELMEDKLEGFKAGGDDYITKPFSLEELVYRMEVFLRRSEKQTTVNTGASSMGAYTLDLKNLCLHHPEGDRTLTVKEASLLKLLCDNQDNILTREAILKHVWGDDDYFMGRSMDVFISKLRKYLSKDPAVQITNYHGVGFRLEVKYVK